MDLLFSFLLILVAIIVSYYGYMLLFMGLVFFILSILKLIDIKGFVTLFRDYDIVAKHSPIYAYSYPFLELILGLCFLFRFLLLFASVVTIVIMTIGTISIAKKLATKKGKQCACLGAKIRVPLTRFTLVEDIIMGVMAIILLATYL